MHQNIFFFFFLCVFLLCRFIAELLLQAFQHITHLNIFLLCFFLCAKLLLPVLPHIMHQNIFFFLCFFLMCRFITELLLQALQHITHLNSFLLCFFLCAELLLQVLPHIMHQNIFFFLCFSLMCPFIAEFVLKKLYMLTLHTLVSSPQTMWTDILGPHMWKITSGVSLLC